MFSSSYSVSGYLDSCSSFLTSLVSSPTTSPRLFFFFFSSFTILLSVVTSMLRHVAAEFSNFKTFFLMQLASLKGVAVVQEIERLSCFNPDLLLEQPGFL